MKKKLFSLSIALTMLITMLVALPTSADTKILLNSDFEGGLGGWSKWAGTVAIADGGHDSDTAIVATDRTELWHAPVYNADSIILQTFTYEFSAWAKFETGTDTIKFAVKYADENGDTHYDTIAEGEVGTDWTELAAEWTAPEGAFSFEIYFETTESTEDFYIDDVTVVGDADAKLPEPAGDPLTVDFEDGEKHGWSVRGGGDDTVEIVDTFSHSGDYALYDSGRTADWMAPCIFISSLVPKGKTYSYSLWVYYSEGASKKNFDLTATYTLNGKTEYPSFATQSVNQGEWTQISGNFTIPPGAGSTALYVGPSPSESDTSLSFYIDDFSLNEAVYNIQNDIPNLKDVFANYGFKFGSAMMGSEVSSEYNQALFLKHFNSITFGNELKPDSVLDQAASMQLSKKGDDLNPQVNFQAADSLLKFAIANNIPVRGHTLVWHSQTPDWFFKEGYKSDGAWLSADDMTVRMENYIKNVFEGLAEQYPDAYFYAYDVVNEAYDDSGDMRQPSQDTFDSSNNTTLSPWVKVYGDDSFIDLAFTFARKYAPSYTKLFYNDYNEYATKRDTLARKIGEMYAAGICDGIGMQSHLGAYYPSLENNEYQVYYQALAKYAEIGCEIQITELDITADDITPQNEAEKLAHQTEQYGQLFDLICDFKEKGANITAVVIWGMIDSNSWRASGQPLLFDKDYQAKPAFYEIIKGRYDEDDPSLYETLPISKYPETETTYAPTPTGTTPTGTTPPQSSVTATATVTGSGTAPNQETLLGDVNSDDKIGQLSDVILLGKFLGNKSDLTDTQKLNANVHSDTGLTSNDLIVLVKLSFGEIEIADLPIKN